MKRTLILLLCLSASFAGAKNIYVSQNGSGSANGADAADAYPESWVNSSGNWGGGGSQVNPGDTVHLVGAFNSTPLIIAGSGAPNNPVTVFFEPGANFTSGCWPGTGAIQLNNQSWLIIDGGPNGLIQNTNNGTGLGTNDSTGIAGYSTHSVIQNVSITNMYRKVLNPLWPSTTAYYDLTRVGCAMAIVGNCLTVSNCNLSDGDTVLVYNGPTPGAPALTESNIFILSNHVYNFNHGILIGMGNSSPSNQNCLLTNLVIAGNTLDHSDVWDTQGGTGIHLDAIMFDNATDDPTLIMSGIYIYKNTIGPHTGMNGTTAGVFIDLADPIYQVKNLYIYNNLFLANISNYWGNGFICANGSNVWVVNNTCIGTIANGQGWGGAVYAMGQYAYCYNNVIFSGSGINLVANTPAAGMSSSQSVTNDEIIISNYFGNLWSDYNVITGVPQPGFQQILRSPIGVQLWSSGIDGTLLQWQTFANYSPYLIAWSQLHCDLHSTTNVPRFVAGTYVPMAHDVVATGQGTNLTFLGITNDFNGNPRPASGPWDVGAFVHAVSSGNTSISAPANFHPGPSGTQ